MCGYTDRNGVGRLLADFLPETTIGGRTGVVLRVCLEKDTGEAHLCHTEEGDSPGWAESCHTKCLQGQLLEMRTQGP